MDKDKLADAVLSDEDKALAAEGTKFDIILSIDSITNNTVEKSEKEAAEKLAEELSNDKAKYNIGSYLNISIFKATDNNRVKVSSTNSEITVTINIPEGIRSLGNSFGIIRIHDGKADFLKDIDDNKDTITFESDSFSTYAIVYTADVNNGDNNGDNKGDNNNDNKGDSSDSKGDNNIDTGFGLNSAMIVVMFIGLGAIAASAVVVYVKKTKSDRR